MARQLTDTIIALATINVLGGYFDHLCQKETKKAFKNSSVDILYHSQKMLRAIGNKRAKLKNKLDNQLRKIINK